MDGRMSATRHSFPNFAVEHRVGVECESFPQNNFFQSFVHRTPPNAKDYRAAYGHHTPFDCSNQQGNIILQDEERRFFLFESYGCHIGGKISSFMPPLSLLLHLSSKLQALDRPQIILLRWRPRPRRRHRPEIGRRRRRRRRLRGSRRAARGARNRKFKM